jgi:hypothetical protein
MNNPCCEFGCSDKRPHVHYYASDGSAPAITIEHPLSGVNSVLRGNSEEREWARKRINTVREMINAGILKTPDEVVNVVAPKCIDCGATEKLKDCDVDHMRCVYCYARRRETLMNDVIDGSLHLKHKDCTPAAKMEPEVVTCDLSVEYE